MNLRKACVSIGTAFAVLGAVLLMSSGPAMAQTWTGNVELPAEDVRNTKHNFFLNQDVGYDTANTTEVCVFCHTPHGGRSSDASTALPLWNRAMPDGTGFTMYDSPNFDGSASQNGQPQGVSLACLSCHDGTIGIDALINAPGSGGYVGSNKTGDQTNDVSMGFHAADTLGVLATGEMNPGDRPDCGGAGVPCFQEFMGPQTAEEFFAGFPVAFAGLFGMAPFPNLTQNLSDDHPISMQIPTAAEDPQFAEVNTNYVNSKGDGTGVTWLNRNTNTAFNSDSRDRIRAYPTGGANTEFVECASCHNPHTARPLFLRLPNVTDPGGTAMALASGGGTTVWSAATGDAGDATYISNNPNFQSAICLSCHEK